MTNRDKHDRQTERNAAAKAFLATLPTAETICRECGAQPGQHHHLSCSEVAREVFYAALNETYPR